MFGREWSLEQARADIAEVRAINPECEIVYGGLRNRGDLEIAAEVGIDSVQIWAAPYIEAAAMFSDVYAAPGAARIALGSQLPKSVDDQINRVAPLVAAGHELGIRVSVGLNQISFAPDAYVVTYSRAMQAAGVVELMLYDGGSGMDPKPTHTW